MKAGTLSFNDAAILESVLEDSHAKSVLFAQDVFEKHKQSKLKIYVKVSDIRKQFRATYEFIKCQAVLENDKASFQKKIEIDCLVASGNWHHIDWSKVKEDKINIFDHFDSFLLNPNNMKKKESASLPFKMASKIALKISKRWEI